LLLFLQFCIILNNDYGVVFPFLAFAKCIRAHSRNTKKGAETMSHTVMVTGADGFIGSHLTEELVKKGHKVKAFCYYNSFGKWGWLDTLSDEIKNEIEVFMGDIRDP